MVRRHQVAIIGVGSIGERHTRCFLETGRADVSICDTNSELRRRIAAEYDVVADFEDFDQLASAGFDAAVICTPAHLHVPIALRLAEAGVHLLIEKPLSTGLEGTERLRQIVREKGLTAGVAYVLRFNPVLEAIREAIAGGRFGRPVQLVYVGGQHFPFYRPAYRDIYYAKRDTGGGAVQDALTHVVDLGGWLVGPITALAADLDHQVLAGVDVEDTVHVVARHGSVMASYCLNQHQAPNELTITVVGTGGTARAEFHRNRWRWQTEPGEEWHDETFPPVQRDSLFVAQANRFLDAVEGHATVSCSLEEGMRSVRINGAILASAETREWRTIDGVPAPGRPRG